MWLRMEDPTHPMTNTILLIFDAPIDFERLQWVFRRRLLQFSRFRQRVVLPGGTGGMASWEDDPSFDLDHHLRQATLPAGADEGALRALVGELMSRQLDLGKPLWQFHLIAPYGDGCVLVGRVHHCLADGPALMRVLLALADTESDAALPTAPAEPEVASRQAVRSSGSELVELLVRHGFPILAHPARLRRLARRRADGMATVGKLLWRSPDPSTILKGRLGTAKRVAWSRPVALAEVRAVGRSVGGTVNDVALAAAAGALRRYLGGRGEPVQGLTIRAGLSVDLRGPGEAASPGNQAGAILVELPVGLETPLARLQQVKRSMDEIKASPEAGVVWALLNALGKAPAEIQGALVETYCSRETAVMANVPGPGETVSLAGAPLSTLMFWVPALGGVGLCLSLVSYAGQVWFGAGTDRDLVPDPEAIVDGFQAELEALWDAMVRPAPDDVSIEAMSARLDEAMAKLETLLEDERGRGPAGDAD